MLLSPSPCLKWCSSCVLCREIYSGATMLLSSSSCLKWCSPYLVSSITAEATTDTLCQEQSLILPVAIKGIWWCSGVLYRGFYPKATVLLSSWSCLKWSKVFCRRHVLLAFLCTGSRLESFQGRRGVERLAVFSSFYL